MVQQLFDNLYMIDGFVREFFIISDQYVLLIDTGFGKENILDIIRQYSSLPVKVILTHGHMDHTGGAHVFDEVYLSEKDWHMYDGKKKPMVDHIDCGDYHFEIIPIPGHTHGSIALYDANKKLLIGGDSIQEGPIYMFGKDADLKEYEDSLNRLNQLEIDTILASHHTCVIKKEFIQFCLDDLHRYQNGELEAIPHHQPDCLLYQGKNVSFFL